MEYENDYMNHALRRMLAEDYFRSPPPPTRDVTSLTVGQLTERSRDLPHRKRSYIEIDGQLVKETTKQKLMREALELEDALVAISSKLSDRRKQIAHLERFPEEDPFEDGTTIFFEKSFPNTPDKKYDYAAIRSDGYWHVTGSRAPQNVTWAELVNWMGLGVDEVFTVKRTGKGVVKVIG